MSRLILDLSSLQVESFEAELGPIIIKTDPATYPDCPTATGCTCIAACQSVKCKA